MLQDNALVCVFAWVLGTEDYVDHGDVKMMSEFARGLTDVAIDLYGEEFIAISGNVVDDQVVMVFETRAAAMDFRDSWHIMRAKILAERARNKFKDPSINTPF